MFAPSGSSLGVTVISLLTASSTACISAHSVVVVASNSAVVDSGELERVDGADELPASAATCVLPVADVRIV
jgi:hypothetical protein